MKRVASALVFLTLVYVAGLSAQDAPIEYKGTQDSAFSLQARVGSMIYLGQSYPTSADSGTNPNGIRGNFLFNGPNIPDIGIGTRLNFNRNLRFNPSIDFVFDEYIFRNDLGMAFPTQNITGQGSGGPVATVMGILISLPFDFDFRLSDRLQLGLSPGLAFFPRIAIIPIDKSTGIDAITNYLNKDGRWFYPQTDVSLRLSINSFMDAGLHARVLIPLWHAWEQNPEPFYDSMMIFADFSFDFYF